MLKKAVSKGQPFFAKRKVGKRQIDVTPSSGRRYKMTETHKGFSPRTSYFLLNLNA